MDKMILETVPPKPTKVIVYLNEDEQIIKIKPNKMYKLGYTIEDTVYGSTILDAVVVS